MLPIAFRFGAISAVKLSGISPKSFLPTVKEKFKLPGCLSYARNLALVSKLAEANTANSVLTEVGMRSTADFASVISACGELGLLLLLENH